MKQVFNTVTDLFSGSNTVPNPDISYNLLLLEETKKKIDTGILTRFFKRSVLLMAEIMAYAVAALLLCLGVYVWGKIGNLLSVIKPGSDISELLHQHKWDVSLIPLLEILMVCLCSLPASICFMFGRLFARARKRINRLVEVEALIDKVLFNLKG